MAMTTRRSIGRERGSIMLVTIVALLLVFLAALFTLRGVLNDAGLTDHYSQGRKNIQASDLALQWIAQQIVTAATSGTAGRLEDLSLTQAWWRSSTPANMTVPDATYWNTCMSSSSGTTTCAQATMPSGVSQTAYVFVQPTGRVDPGACQTQTQNAREWAFYYDVWVHTIDARQQVSSDVESIYKLCVLM